MNPDIIIPTCKSVYDIAPLMSCVEGFVYDCKIIATCRPVSAAANRNAGLKAGTSPIAIMIDDDISGFYEGWWEELIRPLEDPSIVMVSARLLKPDGSMGAMMFGGDHSAPYLTEVPRMPTACVAFRNDGLNMFDDGSLPDSPDKDGYIGSGFEDDDFCARLSERYPGGKFVINNRVRMIHCNEEKYQSINYSLNKTRFDAIWKTSGAQAETRSRINPTIPKIIHFIWIGSDMPEWAQKNINEFKRLNDGYEIKIHDETALSSEFATLYKKITHPTHQWAMRKDLIELSVLRRYGGCYYDVDFWPLVLVDEMIRENSSKKCQLFSSPDGNIVANGAVFCRYNDPGIQKITDALFCHDKEIGARPPDWHDYGTWVFWKAVCEASWLFHTANLDKIIPAEGKEAAQRVMESVVAGTFDRKGAYAVHFEMRSSISWKVDCAQIPPMPAYQYYSEHDQDHWLNTFIFRNKRSGVFFEAGAIEGTITSNTLFFEKELGWTGLLAEANPGAIEGLRKNRPGPSEWCALWDKDGDEVYFSMVKGGLTGWSGVSETIEPQHADRIKKNVSEQMIERVKVPTMRLDTLLKKHGLQKIDYLTLDIEGAEYRVLASFPFKEFDIEIFDIEDNFGNNPIEKLMLENGYKKIVRLGVSDIYRRIKTDAGKS